MGKIKLVAIIIAVLGIGTLAFMGRGLINAEIVDQGVTGIHSIGTDGFNVDFSLTVSNPSDLTVMIDTIKYKAILRDTGEVVAQGTLKGLELTKQANSTIELSPRIKWLPSADFALSYATKEEVWMDFEVDVKLFSFMKTISVTVPIDIKEVFDSQENGLPLPEPSDDLGLRVPDSPEQEEDELLGKLV